ncbi:sulfurtransferase TusA [Enterobacteriaceae endosymbiont of Donacia cincticornis]|uniref:sulfurtransferase TusA family protein n=1 Tax=Enterobacteriaceae endosymbiont of Donacia cincticornis TaxID=2675773 RepID=UPI00144A2259|nr:sulfurtransferase TusA family protein [Enterobacteriaceae endosymbiont of Donacia cincticornis]QJC35936.1 sulfurtransferase TusA [Enterobacteriaceae endosymbiont of Donacia cincticornis]
MFKKENFYKNVNYVLDIRGLQCPHTIIMIKKKLIKIKKKETLIIITNDKIVNIDIKNFCYFMKFNIIKKKINKIPYFFLIKKM